MALIKKPLFILLLLLSSAVSSICTAQIVIGENDSSWMDKELPSQVMARKKFTLKRRLIQNLLTRFNSYYNARTKLEETVKKASRIHQDNYDSLLTLYPYTAPDFSSLQGNLDSIIFDASYGINIHDPRSKWIDNLYLIAGKAFYYKQDYSNAVAAFQHIIKNNGAKTDENTPAVIGSRGYTSQEQISIATPEKKKLFYHRPSRNDALVWLIRSYIDSGAYNLAGSLINTLSSDPVFPQRLSPYLLAMQSRLYFNQQMVDKGIPELEKAVAKEENRKLKSRWTFILGQYYEQQKNWEKAVHFYALTSQLRPDPLMRFYARLNTISVHLQQDTSNYTTGMDEMLAMAQREKYELYRSIIYHRLAQYAILYKHPDEAIAYLKKGLLYNSYNAPQKLKNYYLLAHVLYDNGYYNDAKAYYDSTSLSADQSFKHIDEVTIRQAALSDLVTQRNIVDRQDSLQRLAAMPAEDLENYLNEIVQDSLKARRKRNLFLSGPAAGKGNFSGMNGEPETSSDQKSSNSSQAWYFYNPELKAKGFSAFRSAWGKRPLADNWRIGAGSSTPTLAAATPAATDSLAVPGIHGEDSLSTEVARLMAPIPLSAEQKKKSNDSIRLALFSEASIFSDRLDNDTAAVNTLNELLSRFPDNPQLADIYYRLHILYAKIGNNSQSQRYKQLLSEKYPTSKFNAALAQAGPAPEPYAQKLTTELYETAYMSYLDGEYSRVQMLRDSANVVDPNNKQQARFDLLSAMAAIKAQPDTSMGKALLQQVIEAHKADTPIVQQAQAILDALDHKQELIDHLAHLQLPEAPADTAEKASLVASTPKPDTARAQPVLNKPQAPPVAPPPAKDSAAAPPPAKAAPPPTPYKVNANDSYFVILSFNHTDSKVINESLERFVAYNQKQHAGEGIEVSNYLINQQVILIFRLFKNEAQALKYYKEIKQIAATQILTGLPPSYYNLFIISRDNFILLNSTKDLAGYMKFFSENYR